SDLQETDKQQNPQCAFVSRYHWLKQELHFDSRRMPEQPCKRFNEWRNALDPYELTLVFPASYVNNPASMFGHTLLRIDTKDQDERTRLLAYTLSYAAATTEENGIAFAVKGLMGGYPGVFSTAPYYIKVKDYNDLENRDVWEYRLNFTTEEIDRLLMHSWELGSVYFRYYFFDENCAYHLLSLLEVARPGLTLTENFDFYAIPSDTVRAVVQRPGVLKEVVYRPARSTIIRHRLSLMDDDNQKIARKVADSREALTSDEFVSLPEKDRANMLELAFEFVDYQRLSGKRERDDAARQSLALLSARSKLDITQAAPDVPVPEVRPDAGHETARLSFGAGEKDEIQFQEFTVRPAYHDLMDSDGGYVRGAQIDFFAFKFRKYENENNVRLEDLKLVDIVSLSPRNRFLKSKSWRINVGRGRKYTPEGGETLVNRLNGGAGLTYEMFDNMLVFGMLETTLETTSHFEDSYALGAGPSVGSFIDFGPRWRLGITGQTTRFAAGENHTVSQVALRQRINITKQNALRLDIARERQFKTGRTEMSLAWQVYF
ncbi:MAG: DUF4105 domain-containing protein, partial [Gammaproteobacteria bacterium]|nr:DUF4105 domain-containing protein [Gammaproteobacteria bacterium]